MAKHADLVSIHLFAFTGADPGAVGAGKGWIDASGASPVLKVRNAGDTGWDAIGGAGGGLTVREVDGTPTIAATALEVPNGQLTNPSGTVARLDAAPTVHTHAAADTTSGVFAIARLATGTPSGAKFVRDDGTLAVPAGTNPLTTQDDLIVAGAAGVQARLAKGTSGQVLTVDTGTGHLAWATPAAGGTTVVGCAPWALPLGTVLNATLGAGVTLAANGGTWLIPLLVDGALTAESLTFRNTDATLARAWEWRLYREPAAGSNTLDEVAGLNGTDSFTAAAASNRTSAATTPATVAPGLYWLAVRNTHATNTFGFGTYAPGTGTPGFGLNFAQSKTLGSALGATLDATAATWAKQQVVAGARLSGRVFGQSAAF